MKTITWILIGLIIVTTVYAGKTIVSETWTKPDEDTIKRTATEEVTETYDINEINQKINNLNNAIRDYNNSCNSR